MSKYSHSLKQSKSRAPRRQRSRRQPHLKPFQTQLKQPKYIDLAKSAKPVKEIEVLREMLFNKSKIIIISGAGISVDADIPDFRTLCGPKGSSRDLFDISVYATDESTRRFLQMVCRMFTLTLQATPTLFHHLLDYLAWSGRVLRVYQQNIDGIDHHGMVPSLSARTIMLHGSLDTVICQTCRHHYPFTPEKFQEAELPLCEQCENTQAERMRANLRSRSVGVLRPKILLYGDNSPWPDESLIETALESDLTQSPDAVIIVGTQLKVPGARRIAKEFCQAAKRGNKKSITLWINLERPSLGYDFNSLVDYVIRGDCQEFASLMLFGS